MATSDTSIITRGFLKRFWDRVNGIKQNTVTAGAGLSFGSSKLNHTNSVAKQSTQDFYPISIDTEGHITGSDDSIELNHATFSDNEEDKTDLDFVINLGQNNIELSNLTHFDLYRDSRHVGCEIKAAKPSFLTPIKSQKLAVGVNDNIVHIFESDQQSDFIDIKKYIKYNEGGSVIKISYIMLNVDDGDESLLPSWESLRITYTSTTVNSVLRLSYSLTQI